MIFEQCEDANIDMVSMGTNEIVQWGDMKVIEWTGSVQLM